MSQDGDDGDAFPSYDNSHRAFLQAFLARSTLTYASAKPILAAIQSAHLNRQVLPEDITEAEFTSYINTINNAISPYDYEIRNTLPQTAPKPGETNGSTAAQRARIYALVNTTSDAITQLATTHTAAEIAFVKRVLDGMFDTHNTRTREVMAINSMQALQLARAPQQPQLNGANTGTGTNENQAMSAPGITKSDAEKMLKSMVDEGWFQKQRDHYLLSPRALMELRGWLLDTYNEPEDDDEENEDSARVEKIKLCYGCKDIVTVGQRCKDLDCRIRFHDACTQTLARHAPRCPGCGVEWTGRDFVGLRALR